MLRIHFTADDLARTRLLTSPHPMWELVLSLHVLRSAHVLPRHHPWQHRARRVVRAHELRPDFGMLTTLVPHTGAFPDFLTPTGEPESFQSALDAVLATPTARLRKDLAAVYARRAVPGWVRDLADGARTARQALGTALHRYNEAILRPHSDEITSSVWGERELRLRDLCHGGVENLLGSLGPSIRWESPVLTAAYPGPDRELRLAGRGLTLIPSHFCTTKPVGFLDPELPPVLTYPSTVDAGANAEAARWQPLLGQTRARVLHELHTARSTTELAQRVGISIGAASKHAAALRSAGLTMSVRDGNTVRHLLTPFGSIVSRGNGPEEPGRRPEPPLRTPR